MTKYGEKLYSTFVYGVATSYTVSPDTGPSTGGVEFILNGDGLDPRIWDDTFEAGVLDALKWTDISVGTGTVTTASPNLELSSGAVAGGVGEIETVNTWADFQLESRVTIDKHLTYPAGDVILFGMDAFVDANNYVAFYITFGATGVYTLNCSVYRGGILIASYSEAITYGLSVLRILRWGTTVYFIYQNDIFWSNADFVATAATLRLYSDNQAETYTAGCTVEWFYWRTYVTFNNELVHNPSVVSDTRLRSYTPPSVNEFNVSAAYAGLVDMTVVGITAVTTVDAYEYYYVDRLRILNAQQTGVLLSIIDDDQLITKSTSDKGL